MGASCFLHLPFLPCSASCSHLPANAQCTRPADIYTNALPHTNRLLLVSGIVVVAGAS